MSGATLVLRSRDDRLPALLRFAWRSGIVVFGLVGWMLAIVTLMTVWSQSGYDAHTYWAAGRAVLAGASPYAGEYGGPEGFRYAPPLAALLSLPALLPFELFRLPLLGLNVVALRYVAGSWRWAGIVLLYPWAVNELYVGNINFPIAAALYAAFRESTAPLALAGLAKVAPMLVLPQLARQRRHLRPLALALGAALAMTLPVLGLWPQWIFALSSTETPAGAVPISLAPRLAVAAMLLVLAWYRRTDWLAALGAVVAFPVLWPSTLVILVVPIRMLAETLGSATRAPDHVPVEHVPAAGGSSAALAAPSDDAAGGPPSSLTIVLPAYNEAPRIGPALDELFDYLRGRQAPRANGMPVGELGDEWSIIVVDDGSTDGTAAVVLGRPEARGRAPRLRLLRVAHAGKGAAVRAGMLGTDSDLVVFADADMATPPDQLPRLTRALETADLALGSRIQPDGSDRRVGQPLYRRLLGRLFHALAAAWVTGPVPDTQCGFKGFRREAAHDLFARQRIGSIVFDAEIIHLARRRGYRMTVVPVEWSDRRGSRMRPGARLALRVAWDLFRIPLLHRAVRPHVGAARRDAVREEPAQGG